MVFSTIAFLFQFLPIFLLAYYATPQKYRNITLVIGSLVFYAIGSGWYTLLLLLSLLINYGLSRMISGTHARHPESAKHYLIAGLIYNFGLLVVFKYTNFLIGNLNSLLSIFHTAIPKVSLVMPLGISFFTFQITSYLIDVYTGKTRPARSILDLGVYLCMFPQLISGPICMYSEIQPQLKNRRVDVRLLEEGMETFVLGLSAKTLLANPMGGLWNNLSVIGYDSISTPYAWLGAFAYSFQIYFDFSGYSDMAIGMGQMLGFHFPENFDYPYTAASVTEFWRRWHISLTTWFREYLYIPLGGSRKGTWRTVRNIFLVWFCTGFWHGASWNFILWGLHFFVWLMLEKYLLRDFLQKLPSWLRHFYTLVVVFMGWGVFAMENLTVCAGYFKTCFGSGTLWSAADGYYLTAYGLTLLLLTVGSTRLPRKVWDRLPERTRDLLGPLLMAAGLVICTAYLVDGSYNPFLYFRF